MGELLPANTLVGSLDSNITFNDKPSPIHKQSAITMSNLLETKSRLLNQQKDEKPCQETLKKHKKQLLEECRIVLDLPFTMSVKEKQKLKKKILENGGILSYVVTRKSDIVISDEQEMNSLKQKMARKYGVPIVKKSYIDECIMEEKVLDTKEFLVSSGLKADDFNKGKIRADSSIDPSLLARPKSVPLALLTFHPYNGLHGYIFVKAVLLEGRNFHKASVNKRLHYYVIELHSSSGEIDIDVSKQFCIYTEEGYLDKEQDGNILSSKKQCYYLETPDDALSVYSQLYFAKSGQPHCMIEAREMLHPAIGTPEFQKLQLEWSTTLMPVDKDVLNLVDVIWMEAIGHLNQYLEISPENIPLWKVDEAEGILLQISTISTRENWEKLAERLSEEFYSILPHRPRYREPILTKKLLSQKQDLCQVLRDMVSVSEASGWSSSGHLQAKYRALRCHIKELPPGTEENEKIEEFLIQSQIQASRICVETIYSVHRYLEVAEFSHHLPNRKQLFHATSPSNLVGILSNGLNLPKIVVQERGVERFDIGMLGGGIYFTDSLSTCVKYSRTNKERGTRFLLVSEVALGNVYTTTKFDTSLTAPPDGFDSVHGMKRTESIVSDFQDDEFVIYTPRQQYMHYLVEFILPEDEIKPYRVISETSDSENIEQNAYTLDFKDPIEESKAKSKAGLRGTNASETVDVPLKEVHIRAKLLDLVAEVVLFQKYENVKDSPLECKYVFPLERSAAVCGFEAFINNKHVVGKIKKKEIAHQEYKEAISKGHGAYLMDEESPDIFTVRVGNIPPFAVVIIKITYILELPVNDEVIIFSIPTSVAPWIEHQALHQVTQDVTDSVAVEGSCNYSIQISLQMPFPINTITSPTHEILMKRTETTAVIRANPKMDSSDGFTLLVSLKEIHVPRMWTEVAAEEEDSQASMLVFYPEFEVTQNDSSEIIIVLDASNSMRGYAFQDALQTTILCLMAIPHNCYFNIVVFGTVFQELFPTSHVCNSVNVKKAKTFLKNVMPSLGNTELFHLLRYYQLTTGKIMKNVIIISDGHINNEGTVLQNAKSHCAKVRLFTCGISPIANKHILCQLACWGGGAFEYMDPFDKSKWKSKVKTQIDRAMQSALTNVRVEWQSYSDSQFLQAPQQIMSIFNGCRQVVYGFISDCELAKLHAVIDGEEYETVVFLTHINATEGTMLHTLAARAIIRDWEDGLLAVDRANHLAERKLKEEQIVEFSKKYNLVTSITSFIAVEERDKDEDVTNNELRLMELLVSADVDMLDYMEFETLAKGETKYYELSDHSQRIRHRRAAPLERKSLICMSADLKPPSQRKSFMSADLKRGIKRVASMKKSKGLLKSPRFACFVPNIEGKRKRSALEQRIELPSFLKLEDKSSSESDEEETESSGEELESSAKASKPTPEEVTVTIPRRRERLSLKAMSDFIHDFEDIQFDSMPVSRSIPSSKPSVVQKLKNIIKDQEMHAKQIADNALLYREPTFLKKKKKNIKDQEMHTKKITDNGSPPHLLQSGKSLSSDEEILDRVTNALYAPCSPPKLIRELEYQASSHFYNSLEEQHFLQSYLHLDNHSDDQMSASPELSDLNKETSHSITIPFTEEKKEFKTGKRVKKYEDEMPLGDNISYLRVKCRRRCLRMPKEQSKINEELQYIPSVYSVESSEHLWKVKNITSSLKELLKCKGGLPLCNAVDRHIRIFARKANDYDVIKMIDGTLKCYSIDLEANQDFDFWNIIYPNPEELENFKMVMAKITDSGYCEEDECLTLNIITEQFTTKLEEAGLKSLGIKASLDIKRMLATLAILMYFTSRLLATTKEEISGQYGSQKLENLSQLLAFSLVENFPATTPILEALRFIKKTEQNHSLVYKSLDCGTNWEEFIINYIKEPSAVPTMLSWADIVDSPDVSMCYIAEE